MGSTRVQEDAEDQGVRRQKENQEGGTNQEEPNKEKTPSSIEGKMILAGGKILRLRSE